MLRVRKVRSGRVVRGAAAARVRDEEEKLLSSEEIEGLMDAFSAQGPPPSVRSVAPASGCVRAAADDLDDGIEELVDGVVEGWGDEVA